MYESRDKVAFVHYPPSALIFRSHKFTADMSAEQIERMDLDAGAGGAAPDVEQEKTVKCHPVSLVESSSVAASFSPEDVSLSFSSIKFVSVSCYRA